MPRHYRTKEGDRWDEISYKFYGHPDYYKEIIKANPNLPWHLTLSPKLPAGIELVIPDIEVKPYPKTEELPPWKRED